PITPLCFSDDDQLLAGFKDEFVVLVDVKTGGIRGSWPYCVHDGPGKIDWMKFSPDASAIAWSSERTIVVVDVTNQTKCVIPKANFVGWLSHGRLLTSPHENGIGSSIRQLDVWDCREQRAV